MNQIPCNKEEDTGEDDKGAREKKTGASEEDQCPREED